MAALEHPDQGRGHTLNLTISDTGQGFDPATVGNGLTNMTDRLSAIGGELVIDSAPACGTRIIAVVDATAQTPCSASPGGTT